MSACRSCGARIEWAITDVGKRMPLDADPVERDGAVLAARRSQGRAPLLVRSVGADDPLGFDEKPARSHFATCPHANAHRKT